MINGYAAVSKTYIAVLLAMLFYGVNAYSATDNERSASIYNKLKLLDWLVHTSPTSIRIEESGDVEAMRQLLRSQEMWHQASEHNDRGEYDLAEVHINAGLKIMAGMSRKYKDEDRVKKARIDLYKQVKDHVDMFISAFDRIEMEKGEDDVKNLLDREKLSALVAEAEAQYTDGDLAMANHLMRQAADMVDTALSDARHQDVLLHELSFESLEEEYAYEVNRNKSYVLLIDLMKKKTAVSEASDSYVQKLINENRELRDQAEGHAMQGDYEQGIAVLEKGTEKLSRALRVSGVSF